MGFKNLTMEMIRIYKKGDKVRVLGKTAGSLPENSHLMCILDAHERDFVYFCCYNEGGTIKCSLNENGDYASLFNVSDIEPYEKMSELIELGRITLLELLKDDLLKEGIRFFISK